MKILGKAVLTAPQERMLERIADSLELLALVEWSRFNANWSSSVDNHLDLGKLAAKLQAKPPQRETGSPTGKPSSVD